MVRGVAGVYPPSSVLAGQSRIISVDQSRSFEEMKAKYPEADIKSEWTAPQNTFDHLPGEDL